MRTDGPIVFISHASEDKVRFVRKLVQHLNDNGILPWYDDWEILPGDSLVEKLFSGIGKAQAIIVVLSKYSVNKKWVKEELNASFLQRIEKDIRLIPVVIDDCEIPESLKHIVRVEIKDLNNSKCELDKIVSAIYGYKNKPKLGPPPVYVTEYDESYDEIQGIDLIIFKSIYEYAIETDQELNLFSDKLFEIVETKHIPKDTLNESIKYLEEIGYISVDRHPSDLEEYFINVSPLGFYVYATKNINNYEELYISVVSCLIIDNEVVNVNIAQKLDTKTIIINNILDTLKNNNMIDYRVLPNGFKRLIRIVNVSATLRRKFVDM